LLQLDDRDLNVWSRLAQAEVLEKRLTMMDAARSAWMDSSQYSSYINGVQQSINTLRRGTTYTQVVRENWNALKEMGGG